MALAIFMAGTGGDLPLSPYSDVIVGVAWTLGVLAYGWCFGRTALWLFPVSLVLVALLASWLFFDPDPRISGMDQIGDDPGSIILMLPLAMIVLGLAGYTRSRQPSRAAPRGRPRSAVHAFAWKRANRNHP